MRAAYGTPEWKGSNMTSIKENKKKGMDESVLQADYSQEIKEQMRGFYKTLSEKDKRRYAAVESQKLGYGGQKYICKMLGCSPTTIRVGIKEILFGSDTPESRIRKRGGGKKKIIEKIENIDELFFEIVEDNTAGSPMDQDITWTNLSRKEISAAFLERGLIVSDHVVKQLLKKHKLRERKMSKTKTVKEVECRNEQFEKIADLKEEHRRKGDPVISMDVKKRRISGISIVKEKSTVRGQ